MFILNFSLLCMYRTLNDDLNVLFKPNDNKIKILFIYTNNIEQLSMFFMALKLRLYKFQDPITVCGFL